MPLAMKNQIPTSPSSVKQGIVTILGTQKNYQPSIRRTLSADMSSKKWLNQNGFGFSPSKTISSSSSSSSSSSEEFHQTPRDHDDVWRSIQANNNKEDKMESWDSILSQKSDTSSLPYVHPLVKRSTSLTEKSLLICTESLGSETGSDCFTIDNCLTECPNDDPQVIYNNNETAKSYDPFSDLRIAKYKSSPARPLPPPMPSIAAGEHVQSRRENGRLILEAVSVSPKNLFHAQRREGRLVLTLVNGEKSTEVLEEEEEVFDRMEEEMVDDDGGGYDDVVEEDEFVVGKNLSLPASGMISVRKSMKNLVVGNINMNATWHKKVKEEEEVVPGGPQSLPPLSPVARMIPAAASLNAYEYFWRNKVNNPVISVAEGISKNKNPNNNDSNKAYENRNMVITKGERFVPYSRVCKEPRRSLLFWDSYCIATS